MSLDEDVKDVKINPDWGEFGWWKHMGGCMDDFFFFFFSLCADGGNASSGVILIAPEAESQCFLLQQRLKSTPTDLWREGARLLLQLGPSQSD